MTSVDVDKARMLALLLQHGWNATCFQVLEPGFRYWFCGQGAVAYVDTGDAWVAAGAPICQAADLHAVARHFVDEAKKQGRRACFFATEQRFVEGGAESGFVSLQIGEQPVWSPERWDESLKSSRSLREQLRRARAKGVQIQTVSAEDFARKDHPIRAATEALMAAWLRERPMAPMGFLVQLHPFDFEAHKRYFVALHEGRVVAFLGTVPIPARKGWFFQNFLRTNDAPNGTLSLLIDAAMRAAREESIEHVTLGLAALSGDVEPWLQTARVLGQGLYDFSGLRDFKARQKPQHWEPVFLSYPKGRFGVTATFDALAAFARGGLLRFGFETLSRGPAVVIWALALALFPWTALLAFADPQWFPTPWVKWTWVGFDVVLASSLLYLTKRWNPALSNALSYVVSFDAMLTLVEALWFNVPRIHRPLDAFFVLAAVLAPAFSAWLLWRAHLHRQG